MRNTIEIIISAIPKNVFFDAHAVINYLKENHLPLYNSYDKSRTEANYHSEISKIIATFENEIITRKGECWSMNINGKFSLNKCWIRI